MLGRLNNELVGALKVVFWSAVATLLAFGAYAFWASHAATPPSDAPPKVRQDPPRPLPPAPAPATAPRVDPGRLRAARKAAWEKIQPTLARHQDDYQQASKKHFNAVLSFFRERRQRTRAFAEAVFSLRSKWELLRSHLPYADGEEHRRYLREQFEKTVFSPKELEQVLTSALTGYFEDVRGLENELLVKVRADLADSELAELQADGIFGSDAILRQAVSGVLEAAAKSMADDLKVVVGREVVTWVAIDIATQVTIQAAAQIGGRLGLSTAVLTTGASSVVVTIGVGVAAAFIIDAMIDWILKSVGYDPVAELAEDIDCTLGDVGGWVVFGDDYIKQLHYHTLGKLSGLKFGGLRYKAPWSPPPSKEKYKGLLLKMLEPAEARDKLLTAALKKLILEGGSSDTSKVPGHSLLMDTPVKVRVP